MELSRGAWARADEATGGGGSGSSSPESSPSQLRPKRHQHIARIGSSSDCSDADAIPVARGAAAVASSSDDDSSSPPLSTTSSMVLTPASAAAVADAAEHECGGRPLQQQHREAQEAAALEDAPFEELCQGGWAWTARNWPIKLLRIFLTPIKLFYLFFVARSLPTNHLMLTFRTLTRDFDEPNANADHLAAAFRDELMPARGRLHRQRSHLIRASRDVIQFWGGGIPGIVRFIDCRTQWFDDAVKAAIRSGIKQVVVIAAGYDTRAYRLAQPGVRFYEIDLPHASQHKQDLVRKLLPAAEYPPPEFVAADLSKVRLDDALAGTSFNPEQPTLFTVEGLVYYLPPAAVQQLLRCISNTSAPGSRLAMDFLHLTTVKGEVWHPGYETLWLSVILKRELMYNGMDERPAAMRALLRRFGFTTRAVLTAQDICAAYMPHTRYTGAPASIAPYFGYVSAEKL